MTPARAALNRIDKARKELREAEDALRIVRRDYSTAAGYLATLTEAQLRRCIDL